MIIDVHCHYTYTRRRLASDVPRFSFEALDAPGAFGFDSCVAPRIVSQLKWRGLRWLLQIPTSIPAGEELDRNLDRVHEDHLLSPGPIERFVLLAFDAYHNDDGVRPPLPTQSRQFGSDIYTSNTLIRDACRRRPDRFLFGASVHPYRENAVDCVREVFAAGACLIKWLPLHQNINIEDPRTIAVLRVCHELGLPVLVHYNEEFTLKSQRPEYRDIAPALRVLNNLHRAREMPPVIVAHVATPIVPWGDRKPMHALLHALETDFAEAPLYADLSALTTFGKVGFLRQIAQRTDLHGRFLFGSDFPVPLGLPRLRGDLQSDYRSIKAERSWPQQVAHVYRRLGFQDVVFQHAARLLPNLHAFACT